GLIAALIAGLIVSGAVIVSTISQRPRRKREESNVTLQTEPPNDMEGGAVTTQENEPLLVVIQNGAGAIVEYGPDHNQASPST
ncbi:unnamed protein product, partial [Staurois parvus]